MLLRIPGVSPEQGEAVKLSFTDNDKIPVRAKDTVSNAVKSRILEGDPDGTLRPQQTVSRAEMAASTHPSYTNGEEISKSKLV